MIVRLCVGGATALGPALRVAVGVARRGALGSSVTLCTDGLANVGLGALDADAGGVDKARGARLFYVEQAEQAKLAGVAVSFVSLIGAECKLEALAVCVYSLFFCYYYTQNFLHLYDGT